MVISLEDALAVKNGKAVVTGHCKYCKIELVNGKDICGVCMKAPSRIIIICDEFEGTHDVFPPVPKSGEFEYIRADLVEKMRDGR